MVKQRTVDMMLMALGRLLAALALLFCLPLFALLAIAVKLSSRGPVLHISERLGQFGIPFQIYKFRTMLPDADSALEEILESNPEHRQQWQSGAKLTADPRVTSFGRFLRRSSLDELPQLYNILKGDMVWVGPRPIQRQETTRYGQDCETLHSVKPGLTGLWQVSGRSKLSYPQRVQIDLEYIARRNPWLDLKILLKTCFEIFRANGAC
jgi:lipopolysaccharide/colanic/teichoic acid biosynthesis glycosyltransferase